MGTPGPVECCRNGGVLLVMVSLLLETPRSRRWGAVWEADGWAHVAG